MAQLKSDIRYRDLAHLCRTCLSRQSLIPLAKCTLQSGVSVEEVLRIFIPSVDIDNTDLPQQICSLCVTLLTNFHIFKTTCNDNEKFFKTLVQEHQIKPDSPTNENDSYLKSDCTSIDDDDLPLIKRFKKTEKRIKQKMRVRQKSKKNLKVSGGNSNYTCPHCNKSFPYKYKLVMHARVHTKEKPFKCDKCNLKFSLNGNLKRHKMIHTGERPHVCPVCGKGFIQVTSLRIHTQSHKVDKKLHRFTCKVCERVFVRDKAFKVHMKKLHPTTFEGSNSDIESSKLEFKCNICGNTFAKLVLLKRHETRHGEKKFLCSDCGKGFVRKADLQSHIKVHTGEKPHSCAICNKTFAHSGSLVTHSLQHKGQKLFQCRICTKSFSQVSHLKVHQRTHSGERPYSCPYCEKTFSLKSNLTVHIRTHTGETPFLCNVCGKGFYDSSSMKKHKNTHVSALDK
ncbi:gastrula zinc finger protein XlCGF26.1-like [Euwallacea fornicatus]|uniref:gastrula zinc finger protein XlCGF26.1-like n=1 Tax=Euwallacea fornicatus TaxID=995702 RepID=UPI00338DBABC